MNLYEYQGGIYPEYLREGNAAQFILPVASKFCCGRGADVGGGKWPFPGDDVDVVDMQFGGEATRLPRWEYDFVFSSHCLEHLSNPVQALEHWRDRLRDGGTLFLYLPHPDMTYWRPENCRKHLHLFWPKDVARMVESLGFGNVIHSERDLAWGFAVVGFKESHAA